MVKDENGGEWVVVKPICEGIGLEESGQRRKLLEDEEINCAHIDAVGADNAIRKMFCGNY